MCEPGTRKTWAIPPGHELREEVDYVLSDGTRRVEVMKTSKRVTRKDNAHSLSLDSQASFGITSDLALFGGIPLRNDVTFIVSDWANEERICTQHGMTVFGPLIYSELAEGTILCQADLYKNFTTKSESEHLALKAFHRRLPIVLNFDATVDKVLTCEVAADQWARLCALAGDSSSADLAPEDKEVLIKHALSRSEYTRVLEAVRLHEASCHASLSTLSNTLTRRLLNNCALSTRDLDNVRKAIPFGCNACLCGKSTHRSTNPYKEKQLDNKDRRDLMRDSSAKEATPGETVGMDLMFENKQPFLIAVGRKLGYTHIIPITSKGKHPVAVAIKEVIDDYRRNQINVIALYNERQPSANAGLIVTQPIDEVESDNEGAFIAASEEFLPGMGIHSTFVPAGEHVGYVERAIRTIRERAHATMVSVKWTLNQRQMTWLLVMVANWMNVLSSTKNPDSAWLSLTKRPLNYRHLTAVTFGEFVVAHRPCETLGVGEAQGELGIAMGPVLNDTGGIYFYSLSTGQVKIRRRFVRAQPVDMGAYGFKPNPHYVPPGDVGKSYLEHMRTRPTLVNQLGETGNGAPDTDSDQLHEPPAGSYLTTGARPGELLIPGVVETHAVEVPPTPPPARLPSPGQSYDQAAHEEFQRSLRGDEGGTLQAVQNDLRRAFDEAMISGQPEVEPDSGHSGEADLPQTLVAAPADVSAMKADFPPLPTRVLPRRAARDKEYKGVKFRRARSTWRKEVRVQMRAMAAREGLVEAQQSFKTMNWKRALTEYPQEAKIAIKKEVEQIVVDYAVCKPTLERPKEYHRSVHLFDRKADGTYKARLCVSKTQYGGEIDYGVDLYSPTIDMKVVLLIMGLSLQVGHELTVWDVKGAFLKSPLTTRGVFVRVDALVAEQMVEAQPDWRRYIRQDGSLMLECDRAWYGLAAASALWNKEISRTLTEDCGYIQHTMVPCLYFRKVRGMYCYLMLHVDDIGACLPPDGIERARIKAILEAKYEEMKEQCGDSVTYIGMEVTRLRTGTQRFEVNMGKRILTMGADFGIKAPSKCVINPAKSANPRFMSHPSADQGRYEDRNRFRSLVMTMQYIALVRPHIKFHVSWLASRQSDPTVDDWKKAVYLAEYLLATVPDCLTIRPSGEVREVVVLTDASFDVHADSRSHSGLAVYVGNIGCAVHCSSNKQHCLTRSSTDAEIVAAEAGIIIGDYFRLVLVELGIQASVVQLQDNLACISLAETGTRAYDKKERHMVRRINFMKEYFEDEANRSSLAWCPTEEMTADILTKDLHAEIFEKHKMRLLGRADGAAEEGFAGNLMSG